MPLIFSSYFCSEIFKMMTTMKQGIIIPLLLIAVLLGGCKGNGNAESNEGGLLVKTQRIETRHIGSTQSYSGTIEETGAISLSFTTPGTVERIHVSEGQEVRKGQLLASLDAATMKNAYDIAAATLRQAEDAYNRMKQLHDAGSLPEIKWAEVESKVAQARANEAIAKKSLDDCRLYAPANGVIAERNVEVGQNVVPGMSAVKLVTVANVKAKIAVPEKEIASIKTGQKVMVTVASLGNAVYEGTISEKGVVANKFARSYTVKALLNNSDRKLLPGMICELTISDGGLSDAIILPLHIIQLDDRNRTFVWLCRNGKATKEIVQVGATTDDGAVIAAGLKVGDEVIVEGQQKVSEGMSVTTN